jgi:hypothetical protein
MIFKKITVAVMLLLFSVYAFSEVEKDKKDINPLVAVGIAEGVFVISAWMASKNPQAYGGLLALGAPFGGHSGEQNETTMWLTLAAVEAMAIYNISLDKDEYSESEIFKKNMIGWHIVLGVVGLTAWLSDDGEKEDKVSMSFAPLHGGGQFRLAYRF